MPNTATSPLAALLERAARGDQPALARFYDRTAAAVHGVVMRILHDPGVAEEVSGDVYLQVWRQAARYDPARGGVLPWLLMLARSRALDRLRAARLRTQAERPPAAEAAAEAAPGADEGSEVAERRRLVQAAVRKLPEDQRRVLELAYFRGLTHTEIAAELDEPLGTVKTRIRLGMNRLRHALSSLREDLQ